jgi:hypothetical protein
MRTLITAMILFTAGFGMFYIFLPRSDVQQPGTPMPRFAEVEKDFARPPKAGGKRKAAPIPSFAEVERSLGRTPKAGENHNAETYGKAVRVSYGHVVTDCNESTLRGLAHSVGWMYINAHGAKTRASRNPELEYYWSDADDRVQNLVIELISHGILKKDHFGGTELRRSGGMIPFSSIKQARKRFPSWREPPLTLGCSRS